VDTNLLVESARRVVTALEAEGVSVEAAFLAREPDDAGSEPWLLWIAPKNFIGRAPFYGALATALMKHRVTIYFDTSNVRALDPKGSVAHGLQRFGKVLPDRPVFLRSENLPGFYVSEGILLQQAA
jgi:hypothetical protein